MKDTLRKFIPYLITPAVIFGLWLITRSNSPTTEKNNQITLSPNADEVVVLLASKYGLSVEKTDQLLNLYDQENVARFLSEDNDLLKILTAISTKFDIDPKTIASILIDRGYISSDCYNPDDLPATSDQEDESI